MIRDRFRLMSLHIYGGSVLAARLDRRDVGIDEHDLDALLLEGLDGLGACVARASRAPRRWRPGRFSRGRGDGVVATACSGQSRVHLHAVDATQDQAATRAGQKATGRRYEPE